METVLEPVTTQGLSLSRGAELREDAALLGSLALTLKRAAARSPGRGVRYLRADGTERVQAYPELVADASRVLGGLRAAGLKPGDRALFQFQLNEDFVPAFWACMMGGFVPVPLSIPPGYDEPHNLLAKLENAWGLLDHPVVLAGSALVPGLENFARRRGLAGFRVQAIDPLRTSPPAGDWEPSRPEDLALLLLTSGSTGLPKAVQLSHRNILARSAATAQGDGFGADDVSMNWMPLDHVGGLVMYHVRDVYLACAQIQVATEVILQNPLAWLDCVDRHRVSITWAPNFAFGLVNDQADAIAGGRWDLSSLRFILNGGEAIVSKTARRFLALLAPHGLPPGAMRPAWGMSETSSGVTSSHRFALATTADTDPFVEVGPPLPGVSIRIVDRQGRLVPEGKIGSLQVTGPTVTAGYFRNPKLNAEVFTDDGWFITGDLGVLRDGRLTITGREKDVIIINGVNVYSHELESVVEEIDGVEVSFTAACAIRRPGENTDQVAIFFCPTPGAEARLPELVKTIRSTVSRKESVSPDFIVPLAKSDIPKTAIGKIQRAQLKKQFEAGEFAAALARGQPAAKPAGAASSWFYRRVWRETEIPAGRSWPEGPWLVLADEAGLGHALAETLQAKGSACARVVAGPEFAQLSAEQFVVNPHCPGDYDRVWAALASAGRAPRHTVHLWCHGPPSGLDQAAEFEDAQDLGLHSLLYLAQALGRAKADDVPHRLWVVSTHAFAVREGEGAACERSAVSGLLKTLPQELPGLVCNQVDFAEAEISDQVRFLCGEFCAAETALEIAYRAGRRFQSTLAHVDTADTGDDPGLVPGGCYLISGGMGGIGCEVARYLAEDYQARLLIVGRSPAETVEERLRELSRRGGDIAYVSVDVADFARVRAEIFAAEARWGRPLDGIFHLAGVLETRPLMAETRETLERSLQAKTAGAWGLQQIAKSRPGLLMVNFSSLLGYFGGYQYGGYAAANAFLEGLTQHQRSLGLRSFCLMWSAWSKTGMNQGGADEEAATRAKGYFSLTPAQGLEALRFALRAGHPQLVIGLDGRNANIRPYLEAAPEDAGSEENDHVEPRTETERKLVTIWQELLKRPRLGIRDNFFEVGGRSLLAARIFAQIEKVFGQSLPLATLFKAPTIERLAAFLESGTGAPAVCQVEPLQREGTRPPFFCIPGGASDIIVFRPLAARLGPDQPFYGLQAQGLDGTKTDAPILPIAELAGYFIKEMRAIQPEGPYQFGGHCFGALLAYEIARQLQAQGQSVALLALLDPTATTTLDLGVFHSFRSKLLFFLKIYRRMSFVDKIKFPYVFVSYFFSRKVVVSRRLEPTIERLRRLHEGYALQPYPGRADLFLAADSRHEFDGDADSRLVLGKLAQGGVNTHVIEGNHHTMLQEPYVRDLADKLGRRLLPPQTPPSR
ncbi:MAG: SDR family NAD(P)-dependent oxidoreductase [Opitutaceae bacterium]|jgi:acyl-CoA synthetase (AMP-forming)/AMP-acid ligase II/thioesterase domain-containing protein/NAD(P)-dependent dehydrogenase (short-subunit alcohol dehydrogenase family)